MSTLRFTTLVELVGSVPLSVSQFVFLCLTNYLTVCLDFTCLLTDYGHHLYCLHCAYTDQFSKNALIMASEFGHYDCVVELIENEIRKLRRKEIIKEDLEEHINLRTPVYNCLCLCLCLCLLNLALCLSFPITYPLSSHIWLYQL